MFDEARKRAIESRAKALAASALLAITDDEAEGYRSEMMKCIVELCDDHNSVALQYEDDHVREVVLMGKTEKWNKGIEYIFKLMEQIVETKDWTKLGRIYEMIGKLNELMSNRI